MGGVVVKKDITQDSNSHKWDGGQLGIVIEFESKIAAKRAFYSDVFQNYLRSRDLMELVTISTLWYLKNKNRKTIIIFAD